MLNFCCHYQHLHWTCWKTGKLSCWLGTDMIKIPEFLQSYQQVFNQVIGTDGLEIEMKDKRFVEDLSELCFTVYDLPNFCHSAAGKSRSRANHQSIHCRPKSLCFNCGSSGHQLRDCPKVGTCQDDSAWHLAGKKHQKGVLTWFTTFLLDFS